MCIQQKPCPSAASCLDGEVPRLRLERCLRDDLVGIQEASRGGEESGRVPWKIDQASGSVQ
jgi:hypothetical protein